MSARITQVQLTRHLSDLLNQNQVKERTKTKEGGTSNTVVRYTTEPPESIIFEGLRSTSFRKQLTYRRDSRALVEPPGDRKKLSISPLVNLHATWHCIRNTEYEKVSLIVKGIEAGSQGTP